jgi:hypothetical protein
MKTKVKAVAAAATGALLVGSTLFAAGIAYDLGDLPAPFVENGQWNNVFVLGTGGSSRSGLAEDLGAALGTAARWGQQTIQIEEKEPTGLTGVAKITTIGGDVKIEDIELFANLSTEFGATLDDNDIPALFDDEVSTDTSSKFDAHEELVLGTVKLDQNMDDGVVGINVPVGQLAYRFYIDDAVDDTEEDDTLTSADWTDEDDGMGKLTLPILGNDIVIKSWTNTSIEVEGGKLSLVKEGEVVSMDDYDITVDIVSVDSENVGVTVKTGSTTVGSEIIDKTKSKTIGGVEIKVENLIEAGDVRYAQIRYGSKLSTTLDADDEWPDDERWLVDFTYWTGKGAAYNFKPILNLKYDPEDDEDVYDNENLIKSGESMNLLYDTMQIKNNGFIASTSAVNDEIVISTEAKTGPWNFGTNVEAGKIITISFPEGWEAYDNSGANTDRYYEEIYVWQENATSVMISAKDDDGTRTYYDMIEFGVTAGEADVTAKPIAYMSNDETNVTIWYENSTVPFLNVTVGDGDGAEEAIGIAINVVNNAAGDFARLAQTTDGTADAAGVVYKTTAAAYTNLGTNEEDYYTEWGVVVDGDVGNNLENSDKVVLTVPSEQQKVRVSIGSESETTVSLTAGESYGDLEIDEITVSGTIKEASDVVPVGFDIWKLDTEITDAKANNLVLWGGPTVNKWVKELGYDKESFKDASGNPIGVIELTANAFGGSNSALVVAGYDAANTRMAGYVLTHFDQYSIDGTKAVVKGTTTSTVEVTSS